MLSKATRMATAVVWPAPRLHLDRSTSEGVIRATAFVARCSGAATLAYLNFSWIGLPYPVGSTMSALIGLTLVSKAVYFVV